MICLLDRLKKQVKLDIFYVRWRPSWNFEVKMTSEITNNHSSWLVMLILVEKDTSFMLLAYMALDIWRFMFFIMASAAILDFEF
jgi:hypothetical protein